LTGKRCFCVLNCGVTCFSQTEVSNVKRKEGRTGEKGCSCEGCCREEGRACEKGGGKESSGRKEGRPREEACCNESHSGKKISSGKRKKEISLLYPACR